MGLWIWGIEVGFPQQIKLANFGGKFLCIRRIPPRRRNLQGGRGVRRGGHLPPHKYIRNTSTCGTTPTEHLLNASKRPQTSQKARKSSHAWVGQKKKEKRDKRIGMGPAPLGGSCEGGKVSTH